MFSHEIFGYMISCNYIPSHDIFGFIIFNNIMIFLALSCVPYNEILSFMISDQMISYIQDSRFLFVTYTIIQNITSNEM